MSKRSEFPRVYLQDESDVRGPRRRRNCSGSPAFATPSSFALGEMLFQKGRSGNALYGVRRGQIRIETGASTAAA